MDSWTVRIMMVIGALLLVGVILLYHWLMRISEKEGPGSQIR